MLKKLNLNDKSTFKLWLVVVSSYLLFVFLGGQEFDFVWFIALSNIALLPGIFHRSTLLENKIDDPLAYVSIAQDHMYIGNDKFKLTDIRKVALEAVGQDAYFSLPYNQIKPGQTPNMVFPANRVAEFEQYLRNHLTHDVVFIK